MFRFQAHPTVTLPTQYFHQTPFVHFTPTSMFRFLCSNSNILLHTRPHLFAIRSISTITTHADDDDDDNSNSFTLSYLINSCGLSQQIAIQASKKLRFQTSTKPDSVLALLRDYGFADTHISKIVQKHPELLIARVDKNLKPKLEYFLTLGFSGTDLVNFLISCPYILSTSLENNIIPSIDFFKTIIHDDTKIMCMLKRSRSIIRDNANRNVVPNIELLRAQGVSESNIAFLLASHPRSLEVHTDRFEEAVEHVKKMAFDPLKTTFVRAIRVWASTRESIIEAKFNAYKNWGLSEVQILRMFRAQPNCLMISERNIMQKMGLLVNKMGYDPLSIVKTPLVLLYSMEKRIIPRCLVIKILRSNSLLEIDYQIATILSMSNKDFLDKFVTKYQKIVSELLLYSMGKRTIQRCLIMDILRSNDLLEKEYQTATIMSMSNKEFLDKFVTKYQKIVSELMAAYEGKTNGLEPSL